MTEVNNTLDVLKRIRRIELRTRHLVNETFAGSYHAVFKGRGLAFDSVRAYVPGDDVRDMDWNVTARTNEAAVKRYNEERELTVMLMLDASASVMFGSGDRFKRDVAAELGAIIAFSAISNNDNVGLLMFSDQIELLIPPRKGRNHALRLIRDLIVAEPVSRGTDIAVALHTVNRLLKRRAIIFLITDFLAASETYERELMFTSRRHDVIGVTVHDRLERTWPQIGMVGLRDAETDASLWVDTASSEWSRRFSAQAQRFHTIRDAVLQKAMVDRIDISDSGDYVGALTAFFQRRERRSRL